MKRIILIAFKDGNVEEGLRRLIQLNPDSLIVIPVVSHPNFMDSAMKTIKQTKSKYHLFFAESNDNIDALVVGAEDITLCNSPIKEVVREITSEDVLAMVWDDSLEAHMVLHAIEDYGIEVWNIEDGLEVIEVDFDEEGDSDALYEQMQEDLSTFIESFAEYIMAGVLDVLAKTVKEHIEESEKTKGINPFDKK